MDPADDLGLTGVVWIKGLRFRGLRHLKEEQELLALELQIGEEHFLRKIIDFGKNVFDVAAGRKGGRLFCTAEFAAQLPWGSVISDSAHCVFMWKERSPSPKYRLRPSPISQPIRPLQQ